MRIYVCHSTNFDFKNELYKPIRESELNKLHEFILPHEQSTILFNSKEKIFSKEFDLVIAEVSYPSTGMGIELGWADLCNIKIVAIHKEDFKPSNSISAVTNKISSYKNSSEMIEAISKLL